jgi:hypothetical protein
LASTRWSLLKNPEKQSISQLALLGEVQQANKPMFRAFLRKEELRLLYHLEDPVLAPAHLGAWLAWASRSRLAPFVKLARTIRRHRAGISPPSDSPQQRPSRRAQQPHPPDQPPQLRLPLRRSPHSPRLPVLRRHRHPATAMTFTTKPTGAPAIRSRPGGKRHAKPGYQSADRAMGA